MPDAFMTVDAGRLALEHRRMYCLTISCCFASTSLENWVAAAACARIVGLVFCRHCTAMRIRSLR